MSSGNYQSKEAKNGTATVNASSQHTEGQPAFQFEDHRPETAVQRKLQETIGNSPQVKQLQAYQELANPHTAVRQLKEEQPENKTGLPDQLKAGIESLGGMSMDHVKVHYNSDKPAQLNAHAYAQGSDIHIASGQEKHLPHEAWHVVQQAQGRVKPTMQMKTGVPVNDDTGLETEADVMGAKAWSLSNTGIQRKTKAGEHEESTAQLMHNQGVVQRAGALIGGGIAELFVPDVASTTVCFFGHGIYNNEIDVIANMALGYYCPHESALNSNLSMMEMGTRYAAATGAPAGKWHNYTLTDAEVALSDLEAKALCNANGSALALVKEATSTSALVEALKDLNYQTCKAIHCRLANGADNREWDPVTDSAIVAIVGRETVTRASLTGKMECSTTDVINAQTAVDVGYQYCELDYSGAKEVMEVNGTDLVVKNYP